MNRDPGSEVKKILRQEVGFCCPVDGCGNPYLTWHHFDPPWNVLQHHNPDGMIALCRVHHDQADAGAFTKDQLHLLKMHQNAMQIKGQINWMRNQLLLVTGSGYYLNPYVVLNFGGHDIISFCRDDSNYLLMNIALYNSTGEIRFFMSNNMWRIIEKPNDFICPPSGKQFKVMYSDGDKVEVQFSEITKSEKFESTYGRKYPFEDEFPITVVEVIFVNAATGTAFTASKTKLPGLMISNICAKQVHTVFSI